MQGREDICGLHSQTQSHGRQECVPLQVQGPSPVTIQKVPVSKREEAGFSLPTQGSAPGPVALGGQLERCDAFLKMGRAHSGNVGGWQQKSEIKEVDGKCNGLLLGRERKVEWGPRGREGLQLDLLASLSSHLVKDGKACKCSCRLVRKDGQDVLKKMGTEEAERPEAVILDGEWEGLLPLAQLFLKQSHLQIRYNLPPPSSDTGGHPRHVGGGLGNLGMGRAGNSLTRQCKRGSEPQERSFLAVSCRNVTQQGRPGILAAARDAPCRPLTPPVTQALAAPHGYIGSRPRLHSGSPWPPGALAGLTCVRREVRGGWDQAGSTGWPGFGPGHGAISIPGIVCVTRCRPIEEIKWEPPG